jgi:signal transduction histidine kinase
MPFNLLVLACLTYVIFLFLVAFLAERRAERGRARWLRSPLVYTLSLSIYCTAWTFYGAVGYAARSGLEYLTIYLGPTLVFVGWWWVLRKLVRIGRTERVTSIADMISSRYGKSNALGVIVTMICVVAATPYIALQLQSVTLSFGVFAQPGTYAWMIPDTNSTALWVAGGLALFTILFGTRNLDANEQHTGVVAAIAVEAVVKLVALVTVGIFVVWVVADGPVDIAARINASAIADWDLVPSRWAGLTFLSAAAVITLPRMFQVLVVENSDERFLGTASWAFPLYLLAMSLFVVPIAVVGLGLLPVGANPDLFVLTVPLSQGQGGLAMLAFLGGFSAALAAIGLISFVGVAQMLPAMLGGIFWRGATRIGAAAGLLIGFVVWAYTLFLPSFGPGAILPLDVFLNGPFGIGWLRPRALFGVEGMDPLIHALFWSLSFNTAAFTIGSLLSFPTPIERAQGLAFVYVFDTERAELRGWGDGLAEPESLLIMAQRILGDEPALTFFEEQARAQGKAGYLPDPSPAFLAALERQLAGSVGAAAAHAMISELAGRARVTVDDLMRVADETAQIMEYSSQLESQRAELERTARQLREANEKLTQLSVQKDAFLSQISHELRTPMTSIRAFSEIMMEGGMPEGMSEKYAGIIHEEAIRLTRLLDDLLDLSVLENGTVQLDLKLANLSELLDRSLRAAAQTRPERDFLIHRDLPAEAIFLRTDPDRLAQVFINLISNSRKYCDATRPELRIVVRQRGGRVLVDFIDNGSGIPKDKQALIFEKFARLTDQTRAGGAGLGLAICREVMANLGGTITYLPGQGGAAFRVSMPLRLEKPPLAEAA